MILLEKICADCKYYTTDSLHSLCGKHAARDFVTGQFKQKSCYAINNDGKCSDYEIQDKVKE